MRQSVKEYVDDRDTRISDLEKELLLRDNTIRKLERDFKDLQNKYDEFVVKAIERPTITQNNTQNNTINLLPLTDEHMKNCSRNLTLEHIKEGAVGYAKYALEYPFKDRLKCSDYSRKKITYKDDDGKRIVDRIDKIVPNFFKSIDTNNEKLIKECMSDLKDEMDDLEELENTLRLENKRGFELDDVVKKREEYYELHTFMVKTLQESKHVMRGTNMPLSSEFVNHIMKKV